MDVANAYAAGNKTDYDWKELAGRNRKVLDDAAREEMISGSYTSRFNRDEYLLNAFSVQSRLAANVRSRLKDNDDFKEILRRIMAGKTVEEIRALHNGKLDLNSLNMPLFEQEEAKLGYEKRCAAVAAEAALQREKAAPSREEIDQMAAALRKNESFRAFMREKENPLENLEAFRLASSALNLEENRKQFLLEMAQKVAVPNPRELAPQHREPAPQPRELAQNADQLLDIEGPEQPNLQGAIHV